jgi:hypothetical protein
MNSDTQNIIVLVAGTTDPVCLTANTAIRANTYDSANNYWADNPELIKALNELCKKYEHLALFDAHGWSGDNTKENRQIAGAYLADRLCGSNGEKAYYSGYRHKKVLFHLIGHSHGGNVLNEFTKRAAQADEWPSTWKINSVTYLSTPFFKSQHQVNTQTFSPECKVINVINDFDLTQRVIADFSMHDLVSACSIVNAQTPALNAALNELTEKTFKEGIAKVMAVFANVQLLSAVFNSASYKLTDKDGLLVYADTLKTLSLTKTIVSELKNITDKLSTSLYYPSDEVVRRKVPQSSRYFISGALHKRINNMLDALISDIEEISSAVSTRLQKNDFSVTPLLGDICPALNRVIDFFSLDIKNTKGPFFDLLYGILNNQIEVFDNTTTTPKNQLLQLASSQLITLNLSKKDPYQQAGNIDNFDRFIQHLEQAEVSYENNPSQKNLLKILITLIAPQTELQTSLLKVKKGIKQLDSALGKRTFSFKRFIVNLGTLRGDITPIRKVAVRLQTLLKNYDALFASFNVNLMNEDMKKTTQDIISPPVGSLAHFAMVSHSVSRQTLYDEVLKELIPQINTPRKIKIEV